MAFDNVASKNRLVIPLTSLVIIFLFHIVGYGLPRWSAVEVTSEEGSFTVYSHIGLWKDLICGSHFCVVTAKAKVPGWLKAVQAFQTLSLIGIIISGITSILIMFDHPWKEKNDTIKLFNIIVLFFTGTLMLIGLIVFGVKSRNDFEELFEHTGANVDTQMKLDISYILSLIATAVCLLLCAPLFLLDLRSFDSQNEQQRTENSN